jgi:hypothetical protein
MPKLTNIRFKNSLFIHSSGFDLDLFLILLHKIKLVIMLNKPCIIKFYNKSNHNYYI